MTSQTDKSEQGASKDTQAPDKACSKTGADKAASDKSSPEWAGGLRQLYDSVVEEPLPDSFKDLLSKLDEQ